MAEYKWRTVAKDVMSSFLNLTGMAFLLVLWRAPVLSIIWWLSIIAFIVFIFQRHDGLKAQRENTGISSGGSIAIFLAAAFLQVVALVEIATWIFKW